MLKSKTYSFLKHWDVVESKGHRSGIWRATDKGKDFVLGLIKLPSAVYVYDDTVFGFEAEEVSFRGCFGKHFDFDEMMSSQFIWANLREKK